MRCTSGLFWLIALAIAWSTIVLPALGGETIRPRWPLPIGRDDVDDPGRQVAGLALEPQPVLRVERRQLVEVGAAARRVRHRRR